MRKILRTAAKVLAVLLWIVKGLLLMAVGAAVMWPVSGGRMMGVSALRYRAGPASGERRGYSAECWDGRAVLGRGWEDAWGDPRLARIHAQVQSGGDGWRWERWSIAYDWGEEFWSSRWGPLRWRFADDNDPDGTPRDRYVAAPLWLVAPAFALWPLCSLTLLIRRRRKQRRLARVGCCQSCGYDLRATAEKGGPLLARCPECGSDAKAPPLPIKG